MMDPVIIASLVTGIMSGVAFSIGHWRGYEIAKTHWRDVGRIEGRYRERWGKWADDDNIQSTHYTAEEMDVDVLHHNPKDER